MNTLQRIKYRVPLKTERLHVDVFQDREQYTFILPSKVQADYYADFFDGRPTAESVKLAWGSYLNTANPKIPDLDLSSLVKPQAPKPLCYRLDYVEGFEPGNGSFYLSVDFGTDEEPVPLTRDEMDKHYWNYTDLKALLRAMCMELDQIGIPSPGCVRHNLLPHAIQELGLQKLPFPEFEHESTQILVEPGNPYRGYLNVNKHGKPAGRRALMPAETRIPTVYELREVEPRHLEEDKRRPFVQPFPTCVEYYRWAVRDLRKVPAGCVIDLKFLEQQYNNQVPVEECAADPLCYITEQERDRREQDERLKNS